MQYVSTRGSAPALDFEGVTLAGLASDGGLYVPAEWPRFTADEIRAMRGLAYPELAARVMAPFVAGSLAEDELLYRFEFPERPGALMRFLSAMSPNWNISLFHHRNQGADYGRILVGIQVPAADDAAFQEFLQTLGYPCIEETDNPAYRLFLQA